MVGIPKSEQWGSSQLRVVEEKNRIRRRREPLGVGQCAVKRFRSRQTPRDRQISAAVDKARREKFAIGRWARAPRNLKVSDRVKIRARNVEGPVAAICTAYYVSKTQRWVVLTFDGKLLAFPIEMCKRV